MGRYRNYLLLLLTIILAFNSVDRIAMGIVLQDIKSELGFSDTQLGVLTGIAFALFYSTVGIPIARWADRGNRVTIISVTTALWSAAVVLCGAATSFVQLLLIRVGVAIGEAGCVPPAYTLIADYFSRAERPRAVARYMLGGSVAMVVGYFAAGWLNEILGWRATFVVLGLPGLVLAVLAVFTLREPRKMQAALRTGSDISRGTVSSLQSAPSDGAMLATDQFAGQPSFRVACVALWGNASFRHLLLCNSVWAIFGYGLLQWQPAFFMRSHGLQTGELGVWFALAIGVPAGLGMYLGGEWASRQAVNNERLQLQACALVFVFLVVLKILAYLAPGHYLAFTVLGLASFVGNLVQGPVFATMQTLVQPRMRAMSIALVYFFANLIGMGLGPLLVGALSDALRPWLAAESLRYALILMSPGHLWAGWHVWRASRTVERDLQATQVEAARRPALAIPLAATE